MVDVGAQINHYKVVEHIGRGGMADVWSARDARLNRMVAIKTIAPGLNPQDDPVSLFKREAQTIAQMEHPHILPIYDFGDYQGMLYIVMRFVTGGSLGDRMELGRLPLEESVRLGKAVARALDYAHENNVIHLDLKPQNVLLDGHDSPYLADFGLAARADPSGRARNPGSGTMIYMPPEQFVADTVDKRADLYSFALMMYHLLTGDLPFDMPLAFRQMQFHDVLPALPDYADAVTEVLRRGTSEEAALRPESAQAIMQELESAFAGAIDLTGLDAPFAGPVGFTTDDANLREAVDIYTRAHHAWAGGQGRFLLGVTHFMLMNDYYLFADRHGLEIDLEGRQMLLRGALEYDRDIEHWWEQLDDSNRRWVCLHAVRSENAPARVRALQRLESLPDSEPLRIPRLVAQALQVETDEQAQLAELAVLSARARLVKPAEKIDAPVALHSVMLTSLTRLERRAAPEHHWHETVYTPEIDTLIASTALTSPHPAVRDAAARVVGRIRSLVAVNHFVERVAKRQRYAARALALVRDEAPNLPPIVPPRDRLRAWLVNTARRLTENPLQLTWRFLFALIGAALGMGVQVFVTYRSQAIFEPDRVTNTYAFGLGFGLMIGILALLADEIPSRLRGFWGWPARTALSVALGLAWGTLTWGAVSYMYLRQTFINWELMFIGGLGLALGFVLTTALNLRGWLAVLVTALLAYLPILFVWHNVCWQYGICSDWPAFSIAPAMLPGLLVGLFAGAVLRLQRAAPFTLPGTPRVNAVIGVVSGAALACASWLAYSAVLAGGPPSWTGIGLLVGLGIAWGALIYVFSAPGRLGFALASVALFVALMLRVTPLLQDPAYMPVVGGEYIDFLLFYDDPLQLITATVPFALLLALGAYAMQLARDLRWLRPRRAVVEPAPEPRTGDISQLETWQMIGGDSGGKPASDAPAERAAPKPAALFGDTRIIDRDAPASDDSETRRLRDEDR